MTQDPLVFVGIAALLAFGLVWLTGCAWLLDRAVTAFKSSRGRRAGERR